MGNDVGRRIARARRDRGWAQTELAKRAGVTGSYISRLENGQFPTPSADRLAKIADAFGWRLTDLTEALPPADESEDAALRRLLEAKIGKENAPILAAMLPKLRGMAPSDVRKLVGIVSALVGEPATTTGR